jgi:hypothetical protein
MFPGLSRRPATGLGLLALLERRRNPANLAAICL